MEIMEKITVKKIKKLSQKIARKIKPDKIILFGSFAWGKPDENSDVDLLIIKKTKKKFLKRHWEVREIINGELPVDILVRTPKEITKRLDLGDFFYQDIISKGKYLYGKAEK